MTQPKPAPFTQTARPAWLAVPRSGLFTKYVLLLLTVVSVALFANATVQIASSYEEHRSTLFRIQHEQAVLAAAKISAFITGIEDQLDWTTHSAWSASPATKQQLELWRLVLHQVPAITELSLLDANGYEQLSVSRTALDRIGLQADHSKEAQFVEAMAHGVYYGPVYFRNGSEPYMTLALAGPRREMGVRVAEINLKFIWDLVSQIQMGNFGQAYVVDERGRLIAHTDIALVLRNMDLSGIEQVRAAHAKGTSSFDDPQVVKDLKGRQVLTAYAPIEPLGWTMFTELPLSEAFAPLYAAIARSGAFLLLGLGLAFLSGLVLARRMIVPIQTLREGAAQISRGNLDHRVSVKTGDELEELADQFNYMAMRLKQSYSHLEEKIEIRTRELTDASRQLASQAVMSATQSTLARVTRLITMGEMVASIAHEINQPLAGIVANANASLRWLGTSTPNLDEARAALKQIVGAGHHAADVIGSIRAMFKKDAQEKSPVNINELIRLVVELVHSDLQKHNVSVQSELNEQLSPVRGDPIQLQQVVLNLIMNAIDAMGSITDRPRILRIKSEMHTNDGVLVSVADTGTGVDSRDATRIFDSFFTTKPDGTGMGLSICRSIIEAHKGRIWVSAGVPNGSEFHFLVPIMSGGM